MTRQPSQAYVHGCTFSGPAGTVTATTQGEVIPALRRIEAAVAQGLHAAGFISYEAAAGLNPHLTTKPPQGDFPLLRFDFYENRRRQPVPGPADECATSSWSPTLAEPEYLAAVTRIRELIAAGDCYQVNFTLAERFRFSGAPAALAATLLGNQPTEYGSYLEADRYRIVSASPELFFSLRDGQLTARPMKGTAPRGRWIEEDRELAAGLRENAKERAENLMIVDLLRNDLGMVSETGSVTVPTLFEVETLPTVHQMTSTVISRLKQGATLTDVMQALFPCGSITGAPKRRSMEIIAELERDPRGMYTGCIGYVSPGGEAQFSVAIRTAVLDLETGTGVLGIGSGITHDSKAAAEYAECLAKGSFARQQKREFHLIESLLHDEGGYFLLERHLKRLEESATYFGFPFPVAEARDLLEAQARGWEGRNKVRLLLFPDGTWHCEAAPLPEGAPEVNVVLARQSVDSRNRFLYHKTSLRELFSKELAARPDCGEVFFVNERGEITEGSYSNIVVRIGGKLITPRLSCGLLPGVFRSQLLECGEIQEGTITVEDLHGAEELYMINSVRKWRRAKLVI
ncbi:aminodeoxychorismate synthase component I [Geomesophilobacter sediminis]|uniref:Aminodeoxychorismate synthase component I n=1 Tax=Geomesophilobacter sediminis TaxID=2798584 RepID=A0A8J7M1K1_9BACT|nr:aminodeoxychorismate synthase component I [Geomesophilobacter sediminis]MBJ6726976.1 aminodeoxychorismate synthase component I [Geomesophilobacter sediminis]